MRTKRNIISITAVVALTAMVMGEGLINSPSANAQSDPDWRVERGFEIAPVPLRLAGKSRDLVGLGSYLVNAVASCNDCHSAGPQTEFAQGSNPYFGQPAVINPATYLGGGRDFGLLTSTPGTPHIVSRNLTPDKTGLPVGGQTLAQFFQIMKTGLDLDHLHPPCSSGMVTNCLAPPFDGNLLQIMPWPAYTSLVERDIEAIYEYLGAVPCIAGPPAPSVLHNDCPQD